MEYGYKDIVQLNDFSIYANNDKKQYELWFEELMFYETPQDLINDFFEIRQLAKNDIGDCKISSLETFESNTDTTGILSVEEFVINGHVLYNLHAKSNFKSNNMYAVFQRFSDELDELAKIYL